MHAYIHMPYACTQMHAHTHTHAHTRAHTHTHTHTHTRVHTRTHTHTHAHTYCSIGHSGMCKESLQTDTHSNQYSMVLLCAQLIA